jgi:plasmid stabilization system protein ParE
MLRYRLSYAAQADIVNILAWSHEQLGEAARLRYESSIVTALRDAATQPDRPGSILRNAVCPPLLVYNPDRPIAAIASILHSLNTDATAAQFSPRVHR